MWRPGPRIGLINATALAVGPALEAFDALWPEARPAILTDASLQTDAADPDYAGLGFADRLKTLADYHIANGAVGLLFTCSAFSEPIKAVGRALDVPVLRPDEAAVEAALDLGKPVRILVTFRPTAGVVAGLVNEFRDDPAQPVAVELVEGAMEAMQAGDFARHDRLIGEAAARADEAVLLLGQYSMARASAEVERQAGRAPISGPAHAVRMLRTLVEGRVAAA